MAIDIKEFMKLTGLTEEAAKETLARGDKFAAWNIPGGAAKVAVKNAMVTELLNDDTNAGTIIVETTPTATPTPTPTSDTGAGEGEDEGDGADLDGLDDEDNGETDEE